VALMRIPLLLLLLLLLLLTVTTTIMLPPRDSLVEARSCRGKVAKCNRSPLRLAAATRHPPCACTAQRPKYAFRFRCIYFKHIVSETGFCLRLETKPLGPVDRAYPYLSTITELRRQFCLRPQVDPTRAEFIA
jgi:hypothetical protein